RQNAIEEKVQPQPQHQRDHHARQVRTAKYAAHAVGEGHTGQNKAQAFEQRRQRQQQRQAQQQFRYHHRRQRRFIIATTLQRRLGDQQGGAGRDQHQQQQWVGARSHWLVGEGGFQP